MSRSQAWLLYLANLRLTELCAMDGKSPSGVGYYDAAVARAQNGANVALSGAATVPRNRGMHTDVRVYGTEGMVLFDCEKGRARIELTRFDGADEVVPLAPGEAEYDGALPIRVFAALCAGQPVINAADGESGARMACHHRARLCIEPHVQSWAESPALVRWLVDGTGIGRALDHAHFARLGSRQEEVDPLAAHAVHVHLRNARMGVLQARFAQGTLNFPAMFATLHDAGLDGWLTIEAVHQDYMNTLTEDVLTETIAIRDCYHAWKEAA